jgi:hypothetical protein
MSAIASAHKITEAELAHALAVLDRRGYPEFWKLLGTYQIGTLPYSGYVLAAVIPFAQQKGIQLPSARNGALFSDVQRKQLGVVACGNAAEYESVAKSIAQLQATDAELRQYYNELYAHDWDEASSAMRQGFSFIQQGIRALNADDELLIFSIH